MARRRNPGRPNVVRISVLHSGSLVQRGRGGETVHAGHLDVEQRDVGRSVEGGGYDRVARADLGHHLQVVLEVEESRDRAPDHGLVLGEQDPDHPPSTFSATSGGRGAAA